MPAATKQAVTRSLTFRRYSRAELPSLLLAPLLPYAYTQPPATADAVTEVRRAIVNMSLLEQSVAYLRRRLSIDRSLQRRLDRMLLAIEWERTIRRQASGEV